MSELFDTTHVRDDPEHWDAMALRVTAAVTRAQNPSLLDWLASPRTAWLTASIVAAAVAIFAMSAPDSSPDAIQKWAPLVAPSDGTGNVMAVADRPPAIEMLLDSRLRSAR